MEGAAAAGREVEVRELLASGHPPDPVPEPRMRPFEELIAFAEEMGFDDKMLEEHKDMIIGEMEARKLAGTWGVRDPAPASALALAVRHGHLDVALALLAAGASASRGYGPTDRTPLHDAVDCAAADAASDRVLKAMIFALGMAGGSPFREPHTRHAPLPVAWPAHPSGGPHGARAAAIRRRSHRLHTPPRRCWTRSRLQVSDPPRCAQPVACAAISTSHHSQGGGVWWPQPSGLRWRRQCSARRELKSP
jgi:hypothetical protein